LNQSQSTLSSGNCTLAKQTLGQYAGHGLQDTGHLVEYDVVSLVESHPRFSQHLRDPCGNTDVGGGACRNIGLRTRPTQHRTNAVTMAIQDCVERTMEGSEIRGFNLHDIDGTRLDEEAYIFSCIRPFVGNNCNLTPAPSGTGVFGAIRTSSGFAGFTHPYARFLQIKQHRFGLTASLHMPRRIVQILLFS
jgi:hypothetical protein